MKQRPRSLPPEPPSRADGSRHTALGMPGGSGAAAAEQPLAMALRH